MAVDCEIEGCGVLARGRCASCGRVFCSSHQAKPRHSFSLAAAIAPSDLCLVCDQSHEHDRTREFRRYQAGLRWVEFQAREDYIRCGVKPQVKVSYSELAEAPHSRWPPKRRSKFSTRVIGSFPAWDLGEGRWRYSDPDSHIERVVLLADRDVLEMLRARPTSPLSNRFETWHGLSPAFEADLGSALYGNLENAGEVLITAARLLPERHRPEWLNL